MAKIATNAADVAKNISQFNLMLKASEGLQERLAYVRGWYAVQKEDGEWAFGPSKFIGYKDLTADNYLASNNGLDGRKTEAQLSQWFQTVDESAELHEELWDALGNFLGRYRKEPCRVARIGVLDENRDSSIEESDHHAKVVNLIIQVAQSLPTPHLRTLKDRLAA